MGNEFNWNPPRAGEGTLEIDYAHIQCTDGLGQKYVLTLTPHRSVTIDGATGQVIDADEGIKQSRVDAPQGFGATRKMLDTAPFPAAPWLTPEICAEELSRGKK